MKLCDYGCGQEAKHQLKNGKWCCSESWNSCPDSRRKRSELMKGKTSGMKGRIPWNKGKKIGPQSEEHKKKRRKSIKGKKIGNQYEEKKKKNFKYVF